MDDRYDKLQGNINRMYVTEDLKELKDAYTFAQARISLIFEDKYKELKKKENNSND